MIRWLRWLLANIAKLIRYLTTAKDNETPSLTRILSIIGGLQFFFLSHWAFVVRGQDFEPMVWGTGLGLMLTAIATAIRVAMKANSGNDPQLEEPTP